MLEMILQGPLYSLISTFLFIFASYLLHSFTSFFLFLSFFFVLINFFFQWFFLFVYGSFSSIFPIINDGFIGLWIGNICRVGELRMQKHRLTEKSFHVSLLTRRKKEKKIGRKIGRKRRHRKKE